MIIMRTEGLSKIYRQGDTEIKALDNISIEINEGEMVAVAGMSGSGKTTLLNLIGGIDKPTSGTIEIDGVDIASINNNQLAKIRRQKIGYIFQDFNLIPILTAEENIIMPALLDSRKADEAYLEELSCFLGIENRLKHLPSELSGGQKQRVAIARALYNRPKIILADEPTGNLDKKSADEIIRLLFEVNKRGNTVLLVTHDRAYADMCRRKLVIEDGIIN